MIGPGQKDISIGWQHMSAESPIPGKATIVAATKVTAISIDKETFREVIGDYDRLARRMAYKRQLNGIAVFKDSQLEDDQIDSLVGLIRKRSFWRRTTLYRSGNRVEPAIYFVRKGTVTLTDEDGNVQKVERNGYFGDDLMLADQNKETDEPPSAKARTSAVVSMDTVLDILSLEDCREVVNTTLLGLGKPTKVSALDKNIVPGDITRHTMLGAGSFGQVWLASSPNSHGKKKKNPRIFALKVQSKYQLLSTDQAEGVLGECNIMASLKSPFIIRLYRTFQDYKCVYMLTSLLQGGELSDVIGDGLSEVDAKFYAAGVLEGLTYMHQKHIIHRDMKPENVLINAKGYPVIIDLGFGK
jgi:CRP-like cAMP-binding protein